MFRHHHAGQERLMLQKLESASVVVLSMLLCACGSSNASFDAVKTLSPTPRHAKPGAAPADSIDADMVAAVSSGGSGPPIALRFRLESRPVVGAPAQLVLALVPTPGLEISHIHASLEPEEGLQLQSAHSFDIDDPQEGVTLAQDVTVVPQHEGVLSLNAVVIVDYEKTSVARTYVIPLIAAGNAS
jgi:hypothetical protein